MQRTLAGSRELEARSLLRLRSLLFLLFLRTLSSYTKHKLKYRTKGTTTINKGLFSNDKGYTKIPQILEQ